MSYDRIVRTIGFASLAVGLLGAYPASLLAQQDRKPAAVDQCLACHVEDEYMPEGYLDEDVHARAGLSCAGCHGGDPTAEDGEVGMSPEAGFVGVPSKRDIPQFCGKCHSDIEYMRQYRPRIATDQVSQYFTSFHGLLLQQGDTKVADCTGCHTAHGILSATDARSSVYPLNVPATCSQCHSDPEYMSDYDIPTNQHAEFAKGVHGKALLEDQDTGAPACNDCHGNHGAMPPGITSVRQVCGNCHVNNAQYFASSVMGQAFAEEELHGCEECHGNHNVAKTHDDMIGTTGDSICLDCHAPGDTGYEVAKEIRADLASLTTAYAEAAEKEAEVQRIGMDDVDIGFLMQESHQSLIQARTLVHTFDPEKVRPKTEEGVEKAQEALRLAIDQIEEYNVRRRGLGMATLFITILVVALFFRIRQMETQ